MANPALTTDTAQASPEGQAKPKPDPDFAEYRWYRKARGKQIKVGLMTGAALTGELVDTSRYNLIFKHKDGDDILVPKHAICYLRAVKDGAEATGKGTPV